MKETETPDQWYRRRYPKENHQGLYDSNLGSPPLWPEWTITEYAKYFVESSLPSEQEIMKEEKEISTAEAAKIIEQLMAYGKIKPVIGVVYDESHDQVLKRAGEWLIKFRSGEANIK